MTSTSSRTARHRPVSCAPARPGAPLSAPRPGLILDVVLVLGILAVGIVFSVILMLL